MLARTASTVAPASAAVCRGLTLVASTLVFLTFATPASGQDFYVSATGNDANACTSSGTACRTIGAAIAKASSGHVISVGAGTFTESVVVNKPLTINGARAGVPVASRTAGSASESILDVRGLAFGFDIQADNVRIEGFDIRGDASTWAGVRMFGTRQFTYIYHNFIRGMAAANPNSASFSYSYGIWAMGGGSVGSRGSIKTMFIIGNHISDLGGQNLGGGSVSGGAGVFLFSLEGNSTGTGALISSNTFEDLADGTHPLWPQPGLGVALMQDDDTGRIDSGAQVTVNTYTNLTIGVVQHTANSATNESNGNFTDVDVLVKQLDGRGTVYEPSLLPFNTSLNDHLIVFPASGVTSKAYFPVNRTLFVATTGSDTYNLCTDPAAPCRTIQWAVDRAFDGDTIQVSAGTYAETVTVDKDVTLNGNQTGTMPSVRTVGSPSESIVDASGFASAFDVQADGVTIDGFDIRGNAATWAGVKMFAATDGVTVRNNFIRDLSGSNPNSASFSYSYGVWAMGGGTVGNRGDITGLTIRNNRISDLGGSSVYNGTSGGAGVFLMSTSGASAGQGATVEDNAFLRLPDGSHTTYGQQPGAGVVILQDDEPSTVDGGALVQSNTFTTLSVGVTTQVSKSSVVETHADFSGVTVFVLNVSGLASINETVLSPFAISTTPQLGVLSAPAGSVAYFESAQAAFANSTGTGTLTLGGNLGGGGVATETRMFLDGGLLVVVQNGVEVFRGNPSTLSTIVINGTSQNDTLELDLDLLSLLPAGGIQFNGGLGSDSVRLTGGSGLNTVQHTFSNATDGLIDVDGRRIVTYTGLDPIIDALVAVNRVFTFTAGTETVVLSDDGGVANGFSFIDSDFSESVAFANPTASLIVNLGGGNDTITISQMDANLTVDPVINGDAGNDRFNVTPSANYNVFVNGGAPTVAPGDVLDIALVGTTGANLSNLGGNGNWTFTNRQGVFFTGIETQLDDPSLVNLSIAKSASATTAYPGDLIRFTVTVTNNGLATASGISVSDVLPAQFDCACSESVSEGTFAGPPGAGGTIVWAGIGLAAGESASMTYTVQVVGFSTTAVTNTATITAASPADPNPADNTASVTLNFERPIRFPANAVVQAVAFSNNGGVVETLAGTFNQGLYRSIPGVIGNRWAPINGGLPAPLVVNDLLVNAAGTAYLATHSYAGLYSSADGGRNWVPVDFGGPTLTVVHAIAESTVDGVIYISADDGQVWRFALGYWEFAGRLPGGASHTPWALETDPTVAGRVYAGTFGDGVYRSNDYGETWTKVSGLVFPHDGSVHVFDLEFDPEISPATLWAGTSVGIFFSQDGGATWTDASAGLGIFKEVRSIAFGPVDPSPTATGRMFVATWGGGVFELPSNRATLPGWIEVALRQQQVGVVAVTPDGTTLIAGPASGGTVTFPVASVSTDAEPEQSDLPTSVVLDQNYPNPFNPRTTVTFSLPETGRVTLTVHDVMGRQVALLADGVRPAGKHEVLFDGSRLPSGPYVYRLRTETGSTDRVMLLLK